MEINSISTYQATKPVKPAEPTPPSGGNIENRQAPSEPSAPSKPTGASSSNSEINYSALKILQEILSDFSNEATLSSNQQKELTSRLGESSLLETGAIIDTTA